MAEQLEISVCALRVAADIGVYAHEFGRPQTLVIDVTVAVRPFERDELDETLDYQRIVDHAQALARERIALVETFARRLAALCLRHPTALRAEVRVEKSGALREGVPSIRVVLSRGE